MADDSSPRQSLDTSQIKEWRSIITLIIFILTNIVVLFPFHVPIYLPRQIPDGFTHLLLVLRVMPPKRRPSLQDPPLARSRSASRFVCLYFPMNFVTAPLIADLFLLAILAIGRQEVHDGTLGANHINPLDIMIFFITLAYIAISIDASGLIRYLAFKVLQKGGKSGHKLFFYLYSFFFGLGTFIGNDPIILSGTAFLAYMTRVSSNISHPRAWIHSQFAVANTASAILVSSNPTNLVLAGAFNIKFIEYTANMIVPVFATAIVLFPFLLYIVFANEELIPRSIEMHQLSQEAQAKKPVNPNIPHARGVAEEQENESANDEQGNLLSLEEIMNPFLDKGGAAFGAVIMTVTLVTLLALNASAQKNGEHPVFWVTLPAAVVMFCWDVGFGWYHREETRRIASQGRQEIREAREKREEEARRAALGLDDQDTAQTDEDYASTRRPSADLQPQSPTADVDGTGDRLRSSGGNAADDEKPPSTEVSISQTSPSARTLIASHNDSPASEVAPLDSSVPARASENSQARNGNSEKQQMAQERRLHEEMDEARPASGKADEEKREPATLVSLVSETYRWLQETFPTVMAVLAHLPFALVPFAFAMFVLVQALVTKGWVPVFAYGWDHWVNKTGTIGSIGGMGFLSVILCNFAGTNIGTTILLSRVIQAWQDIHLANGTPISNRTFWATVYSMAVGVNYGAFSTAFSASLAGLLWRDILARKHIRVRRLEFARVNIPIIAIAMTVGLAVLVAEVYIMRDNSPYNS